MTNILVYLRSPERTLFDWQQLSTLGHASVSLASTLAEAAPFLADAEIIVTIGPHLGSDADTIFASAAKLKYVQSIGSGTDRIKGNPALASNVAVCNVHGIHGPQLSEAAFSAMLSFARQLPQRFRDQQAHVWGSFFVQRLSGLTVGIFGLGAIANELAPRCAAFGMNVIGISGTAREVAGFDKVYARSDLKEAVRNLDYLVLLTPLTPETHHIIGAEVLEAMKPTAVLINLARGGVVDEAALLDALQAKKIAGAALDVFETEPLPKEHPFWELPNVLITPHCAGAHTNYINDAYAIIASNVKNYLTGGIAALTNRVQ